MDFASPLNLHGELATEAGQHHPRQAERAPTDMSAGLRQRGSGAVSIRILDLSISGFRASTHLELAPGTEVWLKLPGLESWPSKVVWMDGYLMGCAFNRPLHPAVLANILRQAG